MIQLRRKLQQVRVPATTTAMTTTKAISGSVVRAVGSAWIPVAQLFVGFPSRLEVSVVNGADRAGVPFLLVHANEVAVGPHTSAASMPTLQKFLDAKHWRSSFHLDLTGMLTHIGTPANARLHHVRVGSRRSVHSAARVQSLSLIHI